MIGEFRWLDEAVIQEVWQAAIKIGLSRSALLAGLPQALRAELPSEPSPAQQIRSDLSVLNAFEDSPDPLRSWLETAALLSAMRMQARTFKDAVGKMGTKGKSDPVPQPAPSTLLWQCSSVAQLWAHPHAEKLVGVMNNYRSTQDLRDVAAQAKFAVHLVHFDQKLDRCARELVEAAFSAEKLRDVIVEMRADPRMKHWHPDLEAILDR